jgi:dTDP-4-dehydrorhamnose reductase
MQIAIIGARGQIGSEVMRAAGAAGFDVLAVDHADCDVRNVSSVERTLAPLRAGDAVVNTAAFHRTDACEEAPDQALSVNALGAFNVAAAAQSRGATTVYLSTDFVFDGVKRTPYVESDPPSPINVYGASKAAGEALTRAANPASYIVRVSAVFGPAGSSGKGGNFVESMVAKARASEAPEVVDDIVMAPTSAIDAATLLVELVRRSAPFGIYHLANAGACSWLDFTGAICELIGADVRPRAVKASQLNGKARRPLYSVLGSDRLSSVGLQTRDWRPALSDYLTLKGYRTPS